MCYVSETASLTILKTLVHIDSVQLIDIYTLLSIDVLEDLLPQAKVPALPEYWNAEKAPAELALYGDAWIRSGQSVGLRITSAFSPLEFNYLLNPEHPYFPTIVNRSVSIPFKFDTRLKL
ncbi:MAG: RES family NAD+ phosphorylase [Candidatus Malihini olakiniferum]